MPRRDIADILRRLDRFISVTLPTLPPDFAYYEPETHSVRSMIGLDRDPFFCGVKESATLAGLAAAALGVSRAEIVCQQIMFVAKGARTSSEAPWHQDNAYQRYDPPEALMLWLAVDEVGPESGPVVYARASHRLGGVPHQPTDERGFSLAVVDPPDPARFPKCRRRWNAGA